MSLLYKWAAESNGPSSEENRPLIDRCAARWIPALRINSLIKKTYTVLRKNMVLYGISGAPTRPTHSASKQIQYTTMSLRLANVRNYIVSWAELRGYTWHGKYGVRLIGRFVCLFVFILRLFFYISLLLFGLAQFTLSPNDRTCSAKDKRGPGPLNLR